MRLAVRLIIGVLILGCSPAAAQQNDYRFSYTMREFASDCRTYLTELDDKISGNEVAMGRCFGFIYGATNTRALLIGSTTASCLAPGVTVEQVTRIVVKYADARPEILHQQAEIHFFTALALAFPCPPNA